MDILKKAGIIGGAVAGGIIGGAFSMAGHLTKNKFVDDLGNNIIDSTILTGSIAGEIASGAYDVIAGSIIKDPKHIDRGKEDLISGGSKILGNYVNNAKLIIENGGDILGGIKKRDKKRTLKGVKNVTKVVAVGIVTVGAIKINTDNVDSPDP
jgi:hypothetical protein